tara:strand:- start:442 stop:816 length:375 start_codon:yes stop_codon:yes gene_type:complete
MRNLTLVFILTIVFVMFSGCATKTQKKIKKRINKPMQQQPMDIIERRNTDYHETETLREYNPKKTKTKKVQQKYRPKQKVQPKPKVKAYSCKSKGSRCGCSKYRKSECGGSCCQWIRGSGCYCK